MIALEWVLQVCEHPRAAPGAERGVVVVLLLLLLLLMMVMMMVLVVGLG